MSTRRYRCTHLHEVLAHHERSVRWAARKGGVSETLVRFAIEGKRTLREDVAQRIAEALDVPLFLAFESTDVHEMDEVVRNDEEAA